MNHKFNECVLSTLFTNLNIIYKMLIFVIYQFQTRALLTIAHILRVYYMGYVKLRYICMYVCYIKIIWYVIIVSIRQQRPF